MRFSLAILLVPLALGCGDNVDADDLACEVDERIPAAPRPTVDLLFVIDGSDAMAEYQDELTQFADDVAAVFENMNGGQPSMHVAAIDAGDSSGSFVGGADCTDDGASFVYDLREPWWRCGGSEAAQCGDDNLDGDLGDTLDCLVDGPSGGQSAVPLEALVAATGAANPDAAGFSRPASYLVVVIIAGSDDASGGAPGDYLDQLQRRVAHPPLLFPIVIAPDDSPRLREFAARGSFADIDSNWLDALIPIADPFADLLAIRCLSDDVDRFDADPSTPGVQLSCAGSLATTREGMTDTVALPACEMLTADRPHPETALPCYWLAAQPDGTCDYSPRIELPASAGFGEATLTCSANNCAVPL